MKPQSRNDTSPRTLEHSWCHRTRGIKIVLGVRAIDLRLGVGPPQPSVEDSIGRPFGRWQERQRLTWSTPAGVAVLHLPRDLHMAISSLWRNSSVVQACSSTSSRCSDVGSWCRSLSWNEFSFRLRNTIAQVRGPSRAFGAGRHFTGRSRTCEHIRKAGRADSLKPERAACDTVSLAAHSSRRTRRAAARARSGAGRLSRRYPQAAVVFNTRNLCDTKAARMADSDGSPRESRSG